MLDWSILRTNAPVDVAGNFARGYDTASAIIDKYHERNALATLAAKPNDPSALATLYQVNPALGQHFEARGQQVAQTARRASEAQQFAGGDTRGAIVGAIGAGDTDTAKAFSDLGEADQKKAGDFWTKAGSVAYQLQQTKDPAQRQAIWAQARPMLASEGAPAHLLDSFNPMDDAQVNAAVAHAQTIAQLAAASEPKIITPQQGGGAFAYKNGVTTTLVAPNDGSHAFGAAVPPATGPTATDAHGNKIHFNPATKAWEPLGGAGGNASGGFQ